MLEIFREHHRWQEIVGLGTVGDFNKACQEGRTTELINVAEALQEKKIVRIADEIQSRRNLKLILIAGPSSSGKTTFSKRLSIQLMANGIKPYPISLDDYFLDREYTPRDEHGEYDFESLYALDLPFSTVNCRLCWQVRRWNCLILIFRQGYVRRVGRNFGWKTT